jgi:[ribosomal protein S5]-alanine N-acetyltransferase
MVVTSEPWADQALALHVLAPGTLDALRNEDLQAARALCPEFVLTDFIVSPRCVRTWQRRYHQIQATPDDATWVTRLVVLRNTNTVVGRAGFHAAPDERGMVEVGYEIDPAYQRRGYGSAVINIMLDVARSDPAVNVVRASVGLANAVSREMVLRRGFIKVGEELDNEDGLEEVYELPVQETNTQEDLDAPGHEVR